MLGRWILGVVIFAAALVVDDTPPRHVRVTYQAERDQLGELGFT